VICLLLTLKLPIRENMMDSNRFPYENKAILADTSAVPFNCGFPGFGPVSPTVCEFTAYPANGLGALKCGRFSKTFPRTEPRVAVLPDHPRLFFKSLATNLAGVLERLDPFTVFFAGAFSFFKGVGWLKTLPVFVSKAMRVCHLSDRHVPFAAARLRAEPGRLSTIRANLKQLVTYFADQTNHSGMAFNIQLSRLSRRFMGSGSTGVAALGAGFGFVGIEKDEGYFEIAHKRVGAVHVSYD
jgi:hypothetical protein